MAENGKVMVNLRTRPAFRDRLNRAAQMLDTSSTRFVIDAVNEKIKRESRRNNQLRIELEKMEA